MDRLKSSTRAHSFSNHSIGSFSPSSSTLSSYSIPKITLSPSHSPSKSTSNPDSAPNRVTVIIANKNANKKSGAVSALGRKVIVEKFNPRNIASHTPKQHVKTDMNDRIEPRRWAEKKLYKKDIEAKPWYMRSFDEVIELHMGDKIRGEKYPLYNKSFVTKIKDIDRADSKTNKASGNTKTGRGDREVVFGRRVGDTRIPPSSSSPGSSKSPGPPPPPPISDEEAIERDIKGRYMRLKDMKQLLSALDQQIETIEKNARHDYAVIQQLIAETDQSTQQLLQLKAYGAQVISHTAEVIKKLKGGRGKVVKNYASYKGEMESFVNEYYETQRHKPVHSLQKLLFEEERRERVKAKIQRILCIWGMFMKFYKRSGAGAASGSAGTGIGGGGSKNVVNVMTKVNLKNFYKYCQVNGINLPPVPAPPPIPSYMVPMSGKAGGSTSSNNNSNSAIGNKRVGAANLPPPPSSSSLLRPPAAPMTATAPAAPTPTDTRRSSGKVVASEEEEAEFFGIYDSLESDRGSMIIQQRTPFAAPARRKSSVQKRRVSADSLSRSIYETRMIV